jgi:hypothetical protein
MEWNQCFPLYISYKRKVKTKNLKTLSIFFQICIFLSFFLFHDLIKTLIILIKRIQPPSHSRRWDMLISVIGKIYHERQKSSKVDILDHVFCLNFSLKVIYFHFLKGIYKTRRTSYKMPYLDQYPIPNTFQLEIYFVPSSQFPSLSNVYFM